LVTLNPDGSPQVSVVWVALRSAPDGDELVTAHLAEHKKVRNVRRDPRVAVTIVNPGDVGKTLRSYISIDGTARIEEGGAPELLTAGAKLVGIAGEGGKITPEGLRETLERFPRGLVKSAQPGALSLSQATEAGTIYGVSEVSELSSIAHRNGISVHMDGARFANALISAKASPADMTWRAGVDILTLGATKNGALACEAVVFFDSARAANFAFQRKRGGQTLSKGRFLGAQMEAYLADGLWLRLAEQANASARRLARGLAGTPGVRLAWPAEANEVFVVAPKAMVERWRAAGAVFHDWSTRSLAAERAPRKGEALVRLVASFETESREIDRLMSISADVTDSAVAAP